MPGPKDKSPLLELLNERKAWEAKQHYPPSLSQTFVKRIWEAVRCVATLGNSDPWAPVRAYLYMIRGYWLPSDVLKDCRAAQARLAREEKGDVKGIEEAKARVEKAKRDAEADKAWNQHHSAMFKEERK